MQVELGFRKWVEKVNERLTFLLLNIKEKRDISENDYDLLKYLHNDIWFTGAYPVYTHENLFIKYDEKAEQQGLFNDNIPDGTKVEELNKEKDKLLNQKQD